MTKATNIHSEIANTIYKVAMKLADLADVARIKGKKKSSLGVFPPFDNLPNSPYLYLSFFKPKRLKSSLSSKPAAAI